MIDRVFAKRRVINVIGIVLFIVIIIIGPVIVFDYALMNTTLPEIWDYNENNMYSTNRALETRDQLQDSSISIFVQFQTYARAWIIGIGYSFYGALFLIFWPVTISLVLIIIAVTIIGVFLCGEYIFNYLFPFRSTAEKSITIEKTPSNLQRACMIVFPNSEVSD